MLKLKIFNIIVRYIYILNYQFAQVDIIGYFFGYINFIVLGIFGLSLLVQLYYYLGIYFRFTFHKNKLKKIPAEPVSVIICARNEAANLDKYLPSILNQDYPDYEVIVVNDCSTDDTDEIIGKYLKKYPRLRTTTINQDRKFTHGKKLAVTVGVKAAKHELLVFTDADCEVVSRDWLKLMQRHFNNKTSIVLGYGGFFHKKSLLNNYIRYDALTIAIQYFSYAIAGFPYMGVGRNMAYRKSLFFKNKGFANHYHLLSGDDDLFVNETADKTNTAVEYSIESHTRCEAKNSFISWIEQKKRHVSTAKYYRKKHKRLLGLEMLSRVIYYASFVYLAISSVFLIYVLPAFALRMIIQLLLTKISMRRLNEKYLLLTSLFFDIFSLFINLIIFISYRFRRKKNKWK